MNFNWTGFLFTMVVAFFFGLILPMEYFWFGLVASLIFGWLMQSYWPEDWDIFK